MAPFPEFRGRLGIAVCTPGSGATGRPDVDRPSGCHGSLWWAKAKTTARTIPATAPGADEPASRLPPRGGTGWPVHCLSVPASYARSSGFRPVPSPGGCGVAVPGRILRAMSEMDPKDPDTLYAEGPVAAEPPEDDLPESSPLRDSGGTGPGPDDLD